VARAGLRQFTALKMNWRLGWLATEMRPKFVPRMAARKWRSRLRRLQKAAERVPTLGYIEDKQPLRRDRIADFLIVQTIGGNRAGAVGAIRECVLHEPTRHTPKNIRDLRRQRPSAGAVEKLADRYAKAVPPFVFRPLGMQHLGVGKSDRGLTPDRRARPIDLRPVTVEDLGPNDFFTRGNRFPMRGLRGVFNDLNHVVAGAEAKLLQRHFG
jgi:hypothetical protein